MSCKFYQENKIEVQEKKSRKKKSANEHIDAYIMFLSKLRFDLLSPTAWDPTCHPMCGRFRPEEIYNMDQVPLPFVVNQERTFTTEDDKHVHISAPSDSLRKRQFTIVGNHRLVKF